MTESLGLTDLFHVGIAVHDLDDAIARYTELGIGRWATFDAEMPGIYRGRDTVIGARVAFAQSGPTYLELVQPTKGEFTARAFLEERGEGAYHLGYWVDDLDSSLELAESLGYAVDIVSTQGGFAYLQADRSSGLHMELVSTRNRPAIERFLADT
jgi:catechol 2,3-dioxygenase-like lactoylglutathione lyase family enzyme